jgi:hypothetical protein
LETKGGARGGGRKRREINAETQRSQRRKKLTGWRGIVIHPDNPNSTRDPAA